MAFEPNVRKWSIGLVVVCVTLAFVSWTFAWRFVAGGESELAAEAAGNVTTTMKSNLDLVRELVTAMSGSPGIVSGTTLLPAAQIDAVLDRYTTSFGIDVAYVMDTRGVVVTSSNRNAPDSFVGKDFLFRPYVHEALKGRVTEYFARGSVSNERGVYAGAPIRGDDGTILGVVAAKVNALAFKETLLAHDPAFIVSPDGVIFLSSRPEFALTAFTPIIPEAQQKLLETKQFGTDAVPPSGIEVLERDGIPVMIIGGTEYVYGSSQFADDGWRIILGEEPITARLWRWGVLAGILVLLMTGGMLLRSLEVAAVQGRLARSTSLFKKVFSEGLVGQALCDATGRCSTSNDGFLRIIGATPEELHDRNISDFVHGKDETTIREIVTSAFTAEGNARERTIQLVRADGSTAWVRATVSPVGAKTDREAILLQLVDVSELERKARNLEKRAEELEALNSMILQRAEQHAMRTPAPSERSPEQNADSSQH